MFPKRELPERPWDSRPGDFTMPTEEEWEKAIVYDLKDDTEEETFFVFPDAGCC